MTLGTEDASLPHCPPLASGLDHKGPERAQYHTVCSGKKTHVSIFLQACI